MAKGTLCDAVFQSGDERFPVHRVLMAASSQYCETQFSGPWGPVTLNQGEPIVIEDISPSALKQMIDFAYGGTIDEPKIMADFDNERIAQILDDMLELLVGADRWMMADLHDRVERYLVAPANAPWFVGPENVNDVLKIAESCRAHRLVKRCKDFRQLNISFVDEFSKQAKGTR